MADVARLAGVSVSTVSYSLTGTRPITEQTRQRVQHAMRELGYTPHALARGLKSRRSKIIALLFPSEGRGIDGSAMSYILAASDHAQDSGYHVLLWTTQAGSPEDLHRFARQGLVDGALLMEVRRADQRVEVLTRAGLEFVMIGRDTDDGTVWDTVDADFEQCGATAVAHLADLGHTRIAFVNQSASFVAEGLGSTLRARDAVVRAAKAARVTLKVRDCESTAEAGRRLAHSLLRRDPKLTAVIALNEQAVPGLIAGAVETGRRVPDDLSVVALTMTPRSAEMTTPATTTVSADAAAMGRTAMEMLIRRLEGAATPPTQALFPGNLVIRGTSAPAKP